MEVTLIRDSDGNMKLDKLVLSFDGDILIALSRSELSDLIRSHLEAVINNLHLMNEE